jgi:hypothetical protein
MCTYADLLKSFCNVIAIAICKPLRQQQVNFFSVLHTPLRSGKALVEVSAVDIPPRLAVGAPAQFGRTDEVGIRSLTPALGQDEDYVFGDLLGLTSAQRADFQAREVIL